MSSFKPGFTSITLAFVLAILVAAVPVDAKNDAKNNDAKNNKDKTATGCVQARSNGYELLTLSKKGKPKHYRLLGAHNFKSDVGHTIRVNGKEAHKTFNVESVHTVASSCR